MASRPAGSSRSPSPIARLASCANGSGCGWAPPASVRRRAPASGRSSRPSTASAHGCCARTRCSSGWRPTSRCSATPRRRSFAMRHSITRSATGSTITEPSTSLRSSACPSSASRSTRSTTSCAAAVSERRRSAFRRCDMTTWPLRRRWRAPLASSPPSSPSRRPPRRSNGRSISSRPPQSWRPGQSPRRRCALRSSPCATGRARSSAPRANATRRRARSMRRPAPTGSASRRWRSLTGCSRASAGVTSRSNAAAAWSTSTISSSRRARCWRSTRRFARCGPTGSSA